MYIPCNYTTTSLARKGVFLPGTVFPHIAVILQKPRFPKGLLRLPFGGLLWCTGGPWRCSGGSWRCFPASASLPLCRPWVSAPGLALAAPARLRSPGVGLAGAGWVSPLPRCLRPLLLLLWLSCLPAFLVGAFLRSSPWHRLPCCMFCAAMPFTLVWASSPWLLVFLEV